MQALILTLFPEMFPGTLGHSLAGKALEKGLWAYQTIDIRDFASDKYKTVDDKSYGGGTGLVMKPDVVGAAIEHAKSLNPNARLVYPTPRGVPFSQKLAYELVFGEEQEQVPPLAGGFRGEAAEVTALCSSPPPPPQAGGLIFLCGRYEGVDQRVLDKYQPLEVSLGDYVLSGGEIATQVILDAAIRLIPGVISKEEALGEESFTIQVPPLAGGFRGEATKNPKNYGTKEATTRDVFTMEQARNLRLEMTEAEFQLWTVLHAGKLDGYKFRRQQAIGEYIVDFVNMKTGLVVEVDGSQHDEQVKNHDDKRTKFLEEHGYTVLRFWNNDVLENLEGVGLKVLEKLESLPSRPSYRQGRKNASPLNPPASGGTLINTGLLEYPHYTSPANWQGLDVPEVLLSGNHQAIADWRNQQAEQITKTRRPDLWEKYKRG